MSKLAEETAEICLLYAYRKGLDNSLEGFVRIIDSALQQAIQATKEACVKALNDITKDSFYWGEEIYNYHPEIRQAILNAEVTL